MKDFFTFLLAAALCPVGIAAQDSSPAGRHKLPGRSAILQSTEAIVLTDASVHEPRRAVPDDGREYSVVLEENFSLFTPGSEDDPDKTFLEGADETIPSRYTHTPGWKGRSVMAAGGAVCLGFYTDPYTHTTMTGQLELPELDLHKDAGRAYLSFKAKPLPPDVDMLTIRWITQPDEEHPLGTTGEEQTVYIQPGRWQTVEVDLTECPDKACIQIYSQYHELLIDDLRLVQHQPEVDAPKALKWTDFTGDSFTAHWTEVEGADHYVLNCFYIRREATEEFPADYKYVAKNLEVKENYYHFTNLKPEKTYYYYVRAVSPSGQMSEESQCVEVMALTVPAGVTIDNVVKESFDVSWEPVLNAESYIVSTSVAHVAPHDEDYELANDDFSGIVSQGSVGEPYGNTYGYYDMDVYGMKRAGWEMYEGGLINGGICLHNYVSSYGEQYYGELVSPIYLLSQSTGDITLEADFATLDTGVKPYIQVAVVKTVDGKSTWTLGAGGEVDVELSPDWKHVRLDYHVNPGLVRVSIGTTDGGWLYVDNVRLSIGLPKDGIQILPYHRREVYAEDGLQLTVPTPDRTRDDAYGVSITAKRRKPGSSFFPIYVYSDESPIYDVPDIDWEAGLRESLAGDAAAVDETAYYNLQGIRIQAPVRGQVCIRRQGGKSSKLIAR